MTSMADKDGFEKCLGDVNVFAGTRGIVISLRQSSAGYPALPVSILTARAGSFPQEYIRANSSPVMLLHHLVCCIEARGTATFKHASSSPISRKHSSAAMLVIWARGVSAVYGVAASIIPLSPFQVQLNPLL